MPRIQQDAEIATIAQQIRGYLEAHPKAADTLEGVLKWWLARQRYGETKEQVEKALDYLVVQGVASRCRLIDGTIVYSRKVVPAPADQRRAQTPKGGG